MIFYVSIDPGNKKCGMLLVDTNTRKVIEARISSIGGLSELLSLWNENYLISKIIIGNGTNSKYIENKLIPEKNYNLYFVNEKGSTLRARFRFWEIWPPNFFMRWLPKELLFPPENLDAIVALILLEDFLNHKLIWPEKVNIKIWPEQ